MKLIGIAVILALFSGCGTSAVYFTVKRPAAVSMKDYKKLALGNFRSFDENRARADSLANHLLSSLTAEKYFEAVMDRKYVQDVVAEQKLQLNGMYREEDTPKIGRIIGAGAFIYGTIDSEDYQNQVAQTVKVLKITNKNYKSEKARIKGEPDLDIIEKTVTNRTRTVQYGLTASFQIVDAESARLVTSKTLSAKRKVLKSSENGDPEDVGRDALFEGCAAETAKRFSGMLVPFYVTVRADFQTDGQLPEVELALRKIQTGFMDEAIALFEKLTLKTGLKPEVAAKTLYNLGLAQSFAGNYD